MKILNKKVLVASLLIAIGVIAPFAALKFLASGHIPGITVYVDPPSLTVNPCNNFQLNVMISDVPPPGITDYDFMLGFDSTLMTPLNAWDGGFLMPTVTFNWEDLGGTVHCWAFTDDGGAVGPGGVLATIEFHCDGPGSCPITLEVFLSDPGDPSWVPDNVVGGFVSQEYTTAHTYINPPVYTVPICVPFTVDVDITGVSNLAGYSLSMSYDTASVDCVDIVDACFLLEPKWQVVKTIDDVMGTIDFSYQSGADPGVYGDGTLARITFHCTGAGESILNIGSISLTDPAGLPIPTTTANGRVIQSAYWEPTKLQHIVEWTTYGVFSYYDIPFPWPPATPPGYIDIMAELEAKGYTFDYTSNPETATATAVEGSIDGEEFSGTVTSLWSNNTLEDGTRACMLSAEMHDGTSMAMGFVTNLLPPEQVPEVDPYIIVNAMPYMYLRFYWYAWPTDIYPLGRIITWPYWWYDSHSHPNWFWGPYWWWRCYTKAYFLGIPYPPTDINWAYWRPWWGWWWHWVYWRHWYWWSTYFPYDP